MTVTYPHDRAPLQHPLTEDVREEPFVPVYARNRRGVRGRKGGVKTWMILAPIGVLVLGAAAAALVMGDRDAVAPAPLAEPAATAPVLPAQPLPVEAAPVEAAPVVEATPAPVVRRTAPAPVRRAAAPVRAATPAPRVVVPAEPASPQPYTATLNTAPAPAQTPAPVIVIQPAD